MLMPREEIDLMRIRFERRIPPTLKDQDVGLILLSNGIVKIQEKDGTINRAIAMINDEIEEIYMV